jgi:hypothetical protein
LEWIGEDEVEDHDLLPLDLNFKHEYFMTLRQSFGRTALLLSGGGTFGNLNSITPFLYLPLYLLSLYNNDRSSSFWYY